MQRYLRALGWAVLAAAPVLIATLAVASARPHAPARLLSNAMWVSWLVGALAFGSSVLWSRGARRAGRALGLFALATALTWAAFLVWLSAVTHVTVVALDEGERAELTLREGRLRHPSLEFSISDPGTEDLAADPAISEELTLAGGAPWATAHQIWGWRGEDAEIALDLSRAPSADLQILEAAAVQTAAALRASGHEVERPDDQGGRVRVEASLSGGGHSITDLQIFTRRERSYRLVVTVTATEIERWRPWLDAVRVEAEH